jgi:hypothetical protein
LILPFFVLEKLFFPNNEAIILKVILVNAGNSIPENNGQLSTKV